MATDQSSFHERRSILIPKPEFSLNQEDLTNLHSDPEWIKSGIKSHSDYLVGKTWLRGMRIGVQRASGEIIKVMVKEPLPQIDLKREWDLIFKQEYELISHGVDCFASTYPLEGMDLVVQRLAEFTPPPRGISLNQLRNEFSQGLRIKGYGIADIDNNLIYTEHGFCIIDVLDCTPFKLEI